MTQLKLSFGHWLNSAELSTQELLSFLKERASSEAHANDRLQRTVHLVEEAKSLLAEEGRSWLESHGIPRGFQLVSSGFLKARGLQRNMIILAYLVPMWLALVLIYWLWHGNPIEHLENMGIIGRPLSVFFVTSLIMWYGLVIIHEGLHGISLKIITGQFPRFVRVPDAIGPAFEQVLSRGQYLIGLLTPLVVINLLGILCLWLVPSVALYALLGLLFNSAMAVGDVLASWQCVRAGPRALGTAWGIYAPQPTDKAT